jgi:mono/diheme cytochrome c family protein
MKRFTYIMAILVTAVIAISSCNDVRRETGRTYMPDMAYSRAYESYAYRDTAKFTADMLNKGEKIFYNNVPPAGTIKRGEQFYRPTLTDTTGTYNLSGSMKNPYDTIAMNKVEMDEAGRLFNVNCGICHGAKGGGNGPIAAAGHVGGVANLTADAYVAMADGTMYHSITYGKGVMGSYASQITKAQRWMIIKYIRTLQKPAVASVKDSTAVVKK